MSQVQPVSPTKPQGSEREQLKFRFRAVLIASIGFCFSAVPISMITDPFLPKPLVTYLDSQANVQLSGFTVFLILGIVVSLLALSVWNYCQLYRFRKSARSIAVMLTIVGVLLYFSFGPVVESSLTRGVSEIASLSWGAVLAMMYCKPYDELFSND